MSVFVPLKQPYAGEGIVVLYAVPNPFLLKNMFKPTALYLKFIQPFYYKHQYFFNNFYSPTSILYWSEIPLKNFYLTLKSAKFLKIHLEMEWVDLGQLL